MVIYLIGLCVLVGLVLLISGLFEVQQEAPETAVEKLQKLKERREEFGAAKDAEVSVQEFAKIEEQRARDARKTTFLPSLSPVITSNALLAQLEQDLLQTRSPWRASELLVTSVVLALLVFILLAWRGLGLLALPIGLSCLLLPWGYVKSKRAKYYSRFDEQLADTLMLMANSLKAGFSFLQSMEMVAREAPYPVSEEFQRVIQEISVGVTVNEALNNLADRVKSMDLQLMVTAVIIQREIGSSLAEILDMIASVIRERVKIRGEIRVLTAQGRLTGACLGALPISLGLLLHIVTKVTMPNDPSFVEPLVYTPFGQMMLVTAAIFQVLGFITIFRIVSIRV